MPDSISWEDTVGDLITPGDVVADKYRVERLLGQGGMGVVVEAWHLQFEERVAIKFLLPEMGANEEAVARFEREARAAFKIKSEHVARVIDVGKLANGAPYLVMEFLEGVDLAEVLARDRQLPVADAADFILQTCEAVAEAHALGIVHRDLKPENLFLSTRTDGSSCIKVLDFGLSKVAARGEERERKLTAGAQIMGTPQYMSPEQWLSARDVGPATDVWALGVILYELVTGVQPFNKEQLAQLCTMVLSGHPDPMTKWRPDTPAELEKTVLKCLRKDAKERFGNVGELAVKLRPFVAEGKASTRRIAGVLRKAGIEVDEEAPPSARFDVPAPAPPADSGPGQPGADGGLGSTQVMADPDSVEDVNEARARLAVAEAQLAQRQQAQQSMPPPAYPGYATPSGYPPPAGHLLPHLPARSANTAQSWQHMLEREQPRRRTRLWAVLAAVALTLTLVVVIAVRYKAETPHPEGNAAQDGDAAKDGPVLGASSATAGSPAGGTSSGARSGASASPTSSAGEIRSSTPGTPMVGSAVSSGGPDSRPGGRGPNPADPPDKGKRPGNGKRPKTIFDHR